MLARRRSQQYRYAHDVRSVLLAARNEATRLGHAAIGTEHFALALLTHKATQRLLADRGATADAVRTALEDAAPPGRSGSDGAKAYTADAKKALEFALAQAREEGDGLVTVAFLLTGILREGRGTGGKVLRQFGLAPDMHIPLSTTASAEPPDFAWAIDDTSPLTIYEQLIAQITEGTASGRLAPGERLPSVRQLADRLGVAPGTVARAYSELEARGLLVTEGARGTRVSDRATNQPKQVRTAALVEMLRPAVVSAFHRGASSAEVRDALYEAMRGIFTD